MYQKKVYFFAQLTKCKLNIAREDILFCLEKGVGED